MNAPSPQIGQPPFYNMGNTAPQGSFDLILLKVALTLLVIYGSRFLEFFSDGSLVRLALILINVIICSYGVLRCVHYGKLRVALITIIAILSIPFYSFIFSNVSGRPFEPFSGGDYFGIGLISLFFMVIYTDNLEKILNFIFNISVFYCLTYLIIWLGVYGDLLRPVEDSKIILESGGGLDRGLRLVLLTYFVIFALCVSTARFMIIRSLGNFINFLLVLSTLFASGSRLILFISAATVVFYIFWRNYNTISKIYLAIFSFVVIFTTFIIISHSYNPLSYFADEGTIRDDLSLWARWRSIDVLNLFIPDHWLFGIGISNGPEGYYPITGFNYIFPQDLGLYGVFITYGVFGYLIYLAIAYLSLTLPKAINFRDRSLKIGIVISSCVLCTYSLLSPIFFSNGLPFSALLLALFLGGVDKLAHPEPD